MATAMAAASIMLTLTMGFLFYLEIHKINKQVIEIQEQSKQENHDSTP